MMLDGDGDERDEEQEQKENEHKGKSFVELDQIYGNTDKHPPFYMCYKFSNLDWI